MSNKNYIRVAGRYYLLSEMPLSNGETLKRRIPFPKDAIRDDHTKDFMSDIPKYDGFVCIPNNLSHQEEIRDYYNIYHPLHHELIEGEWDTIKQFIEHIFGEQYELGLDYLSILLRFPTQKLPIFCLVSTQRSTGKTTFLKLLKAIYGFNLVFISNDLLNGKFNSFLEGKLLAVLDEGLLSTKEVTEKLKNLSTADFVSLEAKGKDPVEIESFTKIIICSNNEDNFIVIDEHSERFWVRKVHSIDKEDPFLLKKMVNEIPAFLYFLKERKFTTQNQTRMWFHKSQLITPALKKLIAYNRSNLEKEIAGKLITIIEDMDLDKVDLCVKDLVSILPNRYSDNEVRKVLKGKWNLMHVGNAFEYQKFNLLSHGEITFTTSKGKYYTVTKSFLKENFDDLMN